MSNQDEDLTDKGKMIFGLLAAGTVVGLASFVAFRRGESMLDRYMGMVSPGDDKEPEPVQEKTLQIQPPPVVEENSDEPDQKLWDAIRGAFGENVRIEVLATPPDEEIG